MLRKGFLMVSLRKIAGLAGVSPSTVTRALRNDVRIGAATRDKIHALAIMYHYIPNRLAQSLMTGRSYTVGVILPSVVTPYSARMLEGILQAAGPAGYRVIIQESHGKLTDTISAIQMLTEQRVDGILLDTGHRQPIPRKTILEMRSHEVIPIGLDATDFEDKVDIVMTDEASLALQAVDYLLKNGHQQVVFAGKMSAGKLTGRGKFMAQAFKTRMLTGSFIDVHDDPPYTSLQVDKIVTEILMISPRATAIITWEDPIAALLMPALLRQNIKVPGDISMIGCGNLSFSNFISPTLTTFEQHPEQVGSSAFQLLEERLNGEMSPPKSISIKPTLIIRDSVRKIN
jgi:LacI family transcriptional regulator